jgi:hypothetical protein
MRAHLGLETSGRGERSRRTGPERTPPNRILELQRAAGNRAVSGILGGGGRTVQRAGTGLAGDKASTRYAKAVKKRKSGWGALDVDQRMAALLEPANAALAAAGVPRIVGLIDPTRKMTGTEDRASFDRVHWQLRFNPDHLLRPLTDEEFGRHAATAYHECRHAEQIFRVARKLAGEKMSPAEIGKKISLPEKIAAMALGNPLFPKEKEEWADAERWQFDVEVEAGPGKISSADAVNGRKEAAGKAYRRARAGWFEFKKVLDNDPKANPAIKKQHEDQLLKPGGREHQQGFAESLKKRYDAAQKELRQAQLQYAAMSTERDAWSTGGAIEERLGLKATKAADALAELDDEPSTTTPDEGWLAHGSPEERELLKALQDAL